jgi:flagellar motor switch protein FliN/FliY
MTTQEEIRHLADIPIEVDVELGRRTMTMRAILGLTPGNVIRMHRSAGENIDVLAGGVFVGSGEIVIIEENYGVRITDFVAQE